MELVDGVGEGLALDEAHGVARVAVVVGHQAVDGHDAGVLQAGSDLRLQQEALPVGGHLLVLAHALQCDLAVQLPVLGDEHLAESAAGVKAERLVAAGPSR